MLLFSLALHAQYDPNRPLSADDIRLARIKAVVSEMLAHMPNFTCVQTIERSQRQPQTKKFQLQDTVRLEVALVAGRELYAWPGSPKFEERDIRDMVSGAIGSGDFALHAKSIFLSGNAMFNYVGTEVINGREAFKHHYKVAMEGSRYVMRVGQTEGDVGYQGNVWNDAQTLQLMRIEMIIDEIPPQIPLKQGYKLIDYSEVPIDGQPYVLPTTMEMILTALSGGESRNRAVFSSCHHYTGESTLIFDDPPPEAKPKEAPITVTLPEGLNVPLKLAQNINLAKAAVGDPVVFEVSRNVERAGQLILPKGARVDLRIDLVVCRDFPMDHCFLGLVPGRFSFDNKTGTLNASLEAPALDRSIDLVFANHRRELRMLPAEIAMANKGASILLFRGRGKLSSGFATTWRTLESRGVN
jgi:hypothetical protein